MNRPNARHAIVIGGGASGTLLAYQLLRESSLGFRVTLIERRPEVGRGIAYHTANPEHLLNVRASNMSALPDQPDHFWRWLSARTAEGSARESGTPCPDPYCFAPRRIYRDYIASLITPLLSNRETPARLSIVQAECVAASASRAGVVVTLADGTRLPGDFAILATGHDPSTNASGCYADPWSAPFAAGMTADAPVLILGTGLTMVDYVLSLLLEAHRGPIIAISRRGLLPQAHRRVSPAPIAVADVPFGAEFSRLFRWFRDLVASHAEHGGDWRSVVDGLRPHTQRLWRELSLPSKRRFLEHARAWWDVHRHRMAPEVESRIGVAISSGRLTIIAAKLAGVEQDAAGAYVRYRRRGQSKAESMHVARIVDCTGIIEYPMQAANPLLVSLFDQGLARTDPVGIGIEVSPNCAIVDRHGTPSRRLFAVGSLTQAAFWEIIAIPDIRNQCAELAVRLTHAQAVDEEDGPLVDLRTEGQPGLDAATT